MTDPRARRTTGEIRALTLTRVILFVVSVILALMILGPLLWVASISLKPPDEVFGTNLLPRRPTLANFVLVLTRLDFLRSLLNTFVVSASVSAIALLTHSMAAYALARLRFPGRDLIFFAIVATYLVSLPVILVPLFVLVRALGMLDSFAGLIIPSVFNAFGIVLLRQVYLGIPRELEEAAMLDGAGYWRIYWSLVLPMSRPVLSALAILFFLSNWNGFLWPLTVASDRKFWLVQVAMANFQSQYMASWNAVMAASLVAALPMTVVYAVFQRRIVASLKTGHRL